jgi:hypothetical protein
MEELLEKQNKHLEQIANLMKTDRLMQLAQTYGIRNIDEEDNHASIQLDHIATSIDSLKKQEHEDKTESSIKDNTNTNTIVETLQKTTKESKYASEKQAKEHLAELKNLQKVFKDNNFKTVAEKSITTPIFKSIGDKFRDLKTSAVNVKDTLTGGQLIKTAGQKIASAISPRYKDRLEYIKNERNLGNRAQEKTLKENYAERSRFLQRNVANEAMLKKARGSLTEEEFLKGGSKVAKQYEKEKIAVGKGIKATDTRYSIDDKIAERERKAAIRKENKLKESTDVISDVAKKKATNIVPMGKINLKEPKPIFGASEEAKSEEAFATKQYQDTQIENDLKQTKLFEDQLDVQKEILKVIKEKSTAEISDGNGTKGVFDTIGDFFGDMFGKETKPTPETVPSEKGKTASGKEGKTAGKKGGKFGKIGNFLKGSAKTLLKGGAGIVGGLALEAGGDTLKESGYQTAGDIVSTTGSAVEGASTGAMVGGMAGSVLGPVGAAAGSAIGAGAGAIMGTAQGFSDSFGEGGFELIQKLRKEDAISYGLSTTPTVDKWDVIEKLSKEEIQTLINTNEFEGNDLQHLEKLLEPPQSVKTSSIEAPNVVTKEGVSINQEGWDNKSLEPIKQKANPISQTDDTKSEFKQALKTGTKAESINFDQNKKDFFEKPKLTIPEVKQPTVGNAIYEDSKTNSELKNIKPESAPIINAPSVTNTTNNTTQNSVIRLPVRDVSTTIQDYFKSRY